MEDTFAKKVKPFNWLAYHRKIHTTDSLARKKWHGSQLCMLCGEANKTVDHLFAVCAFSKMVWDHFEVTWVIGDDLLTVEKLWTLLEGKYHGQSGKNGDGLSYSCSLLGYMVRGTKMFSIEKPLC